MPDRPNKQLDPNAVPDWISGVRLERPLAVLDLETTGIAPHRDRIIEIAILKLHPDGRKETLCRRINPGIAIPPESTAIHGIYDDDVMREPEFRRVAPSLVEYLQDCDLAGFGILMFDLPILRIEFERAGVTFPMERRRVIDAKTIYHIKEPRTLSAAHEFYCNTTFADAHSAEADALATYRVLLGQLQRYKDLPQSMSELHRVCNPEEADFVDSEGKLKWRGNEVYFNFGKHRGEPLREVCVTDPAYVNHLVASDFRAELKTILAGAMLGQLPDREASARVDGGRNERENATDERA